MTRLPALDRRRAGVLLHPTSLPGDGLGAEARRFVDFLAGTGTSVWQMLPLGPTHREASPYHCLSVHALNPNLLPMSGKTTPADLLRPERMAERLAFENFCASEAHWLEDYALFKVLRAHHGTQPWWAWPPALRDRAPQALEAASASLAVEINQIRFEQYQLAKAFADLRQYAHALGVRLFGDLPIFVAHDSADVWAHRHYFKLDPEGWPRVVAGVPPDYFSATGQRWGNPLYDWEAMAADGFHWWRERLATEFARFDLVRIDHFRGFEACWEIPVDEPTAINGRWLPVPGEALFTALQQHFGALPVVAEDLGIITPEVVALRQRFGLPGMLVLQFAFDSGPDNPYLPHNHQSDAVVYTGTHDNNTTLAWFNGLNEQAQRDVLDYLESTEPMPRALVHAALNSVAKLAVIPMQDLLGLGDGHRMNTPGTTTGNWQWRFDWTQLTNETAEWWMDSVERAGRAA